MKQPMERPDSPPAQPRAQTPANRTIDTATLDVLTSWQRDDATSDLDELRAAQQELAEFKKALNENRTLSGQPVLYP